MPDPRGEGTVTWRALLSETTSAVGRTRARWLCETAGGFDSSDDLLADLDVPAGRRSVAHLDAMLARLSAGEPLQYVLGRWGFRRLDLMVDRRVLIPRPETEQVVEIALRRAPSLPGPLVCADLGTGSGAIGLSLAVELPPALDAVVWLTDAEEDALDVARANAAGCGRAAVRVRFGHGSWYRALPDDLFGRLGLVVSNPPYVSADDPGLEPLVRDWEPASALFGGADGLDAIREVVAGAVEWLAPGGVLVLEIGATQGAAVRELLHSHGFADVEVVADLAGHDRVAVGTRIPRPDPLLIG